MVTPIAGEVLEEAARTAAGVEATTTEVAETAATMIETIPGTGTAEEEATAARTTIIARPGTITTGIHDRILARAVEEEEEADTTSGTIRIRCVAVVSSLRYRYWHKNEVANMCVPNTNFIIQYSAVLQKLLLSYSAISFII